MPQNRLPTDSPTPRKQWGWLVIQLILMLLLLWGWNYFLYSTTIRTVPYSEFKALLARGAISDVAIGETEITGRIDPSKEPPPVAESLTGAGSPKPGASPTSSKPFSFRTVRVEDPKLVEQLQAAKIAYSGSTPGIITQLLGSWILPLGIMLFFWLYVSRMSGSAGQAILGIGKSKARVLVDKDTGTSFADVAGCDEAKFELQEVVDFLKHPARYLALGARIPKGALLVGPPGTGKTLLGRAVAGEAKVPFFSLSGSEFVEMFVGVGAARVRDLFVQAKAQAPCIIFIDELDAIGRTRGVHMGVGGHDEREQTLNQLLVELDGFDPNVGIIILAATNRPEVLDRALLRPGRFDRQIIVDSPDLDGREAVLKVHSRNKPLSDNVNLRDIARGTPGFSGADLANTLNEAALLAARRQAKAIEQQDLEEALEKVIAGPERKSRRLTEDEKRRVAYHETGHALVAAYSKNADPVRKISIIPRGRAALGYTMQLPTEQQFLMTREGILDRIRGLLGGRAAEEIVCGQVSTGAENDLDRATAMARQMVCVYGMNELVGLARTVHRDPSPFITEPDGSFVRDCSEATAQVIDREVKRILGSSYAEAREMLTSHRDQLELVATQLIQREALDGPSFYELIHRPAPPGAEIPG
ncbi:MAG: ATP-dependent zinc metalloprotease FtsH [Verrucomicrobiota bacterium]